MCCNISVFMVFYIGAEATYVIWGQTDTGPERLGPHRPASNLLVLNTEVVKSKISRPKFIEIAANT
jgi:hypothetical protein